MDPCKRFGLCLEPPSADVRSVSPCQLLVPSARSSSPARAGSAPACRTRSRSSSWCSSATARRSTCGTRSSTTGTSSTTCAPRARCSSTTWPTCPHGGAGRSSAPTACRRRCARTRARAACASIDATCPLVTKVHVEALRYARDGYEILLIGHRGHVEVDRHARARAGAACTWSRRSTTSRALEVRDPERVAVRDADDALGRRHARDRRGDPRSRFPAIRLPRQGRHLLRDAEPPERGEGAGAAERAGAW